MKVIAVAGVSGSGKTTIAQRVAQMLPNGRVLCFDDYDFPGAVEDFSQWVKAGADYNVWDLTLLVEDISRIRAESACDYLVLDCPVGRSNHQIKQQIDWAVYIDTPLDVAMARRIMRGDYETLKQLRNETEHYLHSGREAYLQMQSQVKPGCDWSVDGTENLETIAKNIVQRVINQKE